MVLMSAVKWIEFNVRFQGSPIINEGWYVKQHDGICAFEMGLHSKNCKIHSYFSGSFESKTPQAS